MKVYDLTHPFSTEMSIWPGTPGMSEEIVDTIEKDGFQLGLFTLNSHAGTHADAPCHFVTGGKSMQEVDPSRFVGNTLIVDCTAKGAPRAEITVEDLKGHKSEIEKYKRVIMKTGWASQWEKEGYYSEYPVITEECAQWLTDLGVVLIGVEMPSVHLERQAEVHRIFLSHEVAIVESLTGLDKVAEDVVFFSACPIPVKGADGFPVRALAIVM